MTNISEEIAVDNSFNIIDILLIDHAYLKECIAVLTNDYANKNEKIFYARTFLDTLKKHSESEEKTVYESLSEMDELRMLILEGEAEHGMAKFKYEKLIPRLAKMKVLDDVTEAEIKVLAELVEHHIDDEETELFPKMRYNLDQGILNEIGFQFMILRQFTPQDLKDYPELQGQLYQQNFTEPKRSRKNIYQWSGNFVRKVNRYISSLVAQAPSLKNHIH
ncbi:hemerythrin domain-containing protein [Bacteriovorax sp. PP10]|uniref:Hemerythrin domain-containing protein n=1 Tax=Bacteriovorax antarcticus TaxID=3088717 RepID=A0ABU5VRQ8_9BACT|nr:hemerythrin domain-containing protein [Bacteriovorax sp. PP10]MEA9355728.1 hemerythrin domain-containing protein [Bacteriovorax sp. PP10]